MQCILLASTCIYEALLGSTEATCEKCLQPLVAACV